VLEVLVLVDMVEEEWWCWGFGILVAVGPGIGGRVLVRVAFARRQVPYFVPLNPPGSPHPPVWIPSPPIHSCSTKANACSPCSWLCGLSFSLCPLPRLPLGMLLGV
jgi:hypothetical protein